MNVMLWARRMLLCGSLALIGTLGVAEAAPPATAAPATPPKAPPAAALAPDTPVSESSTPAAPDSKAPTVSTPTVPGPPAKWSPMKSSPSPGGTLQCVPPQPLGCTPTVQQGTPDSPFSCSWLTDLFGDDDTSAKVATPPTAPAAADSTIHCGWLEDWWQFENKGVSTAGDCCQTAGHCAETGNVPCVQPVGGCAPAVGCNPANGHACCINHTGSCAAGTCTCRGCRNGTGCLCCGRHSGAHGGAAGGHFLADLDGDGRPDYAGYGTCRSCGRRGRLYGLGFCRHCCGIPVPGLFGMGIPVPGLFGMGIPVPGFLAGHGHGLGHGLLRPGHDGAFAGTYARVYAVNPYYHDFRDGAIYAAQGYNAPISVPLAPNVDYQWNYGWGIPSSRLTPVSRVVPSPYAVQPQYVVPRGYRPVGGRSLRPVPQGEASGGNDENGA